MTGTDLAEQQSAVPALYDGASQITAEDIEFPRLYIAQPGHSFTVEGIAQYGDLVLAAGKDDPDAQVIFPYVEKPKDDEGVLIHPLALRKSLSDDSTGELVRYRIDDESAPASAWTVYTYFLALPGVEEDVPVKWLTWRTRKPAAQKINTRLAKTSGQHPMYANAFLLTSARRHNTVEDYRWSIPRVRPVDADEDNIKIAEPLYAMVNQNRRAVEKSDTDPDI